MNLDSSIESLGAKNAQEGPSAQRNAVMSGGIPAIRVEKL